MIHRVVFEIEVDAESTLEAAKIVQYWLRGDEFHLYVQPCDESGNVFSVDLQEMDEDAVEKIDNYVPIIK